ncbi:acyl-CoA thioesterase [Jiella mangrovi]|uniref:Acyl-CoA thioesterase n=1 Tax=Jiella mangrovi TaxID=2821407 RepID=A0ABS4BJB8_9HYPH|nr:thioesterase family protein [Jiella mangrovi]MBP0616114.1 acyl-CoA thioesterase [Jiella mangrovi]
MTEPAFEDFPATARDKLRYGDTDRQGHVNNAVYSTFFETGRVELLHVGHAPPPAGTSFVLARISINFRREMHWPGEIEIGSGIASLGNSSIKVRQGVFQNGRLCAAADSVIVLIDEKTRRSTPLPDDMRQALATLAMKTGIAATD